MTEKQMRSTINKTAKAVRKEHEKTAPKEKKLIDINWSLPYLGIDLPNGESYFFQGEEASKMLEEGVNTSNKFQTSVEDSLLWMAQSW
jgi:hypothetical protein